MRPLHGIALKLCSVLIFIAMSAMIKATSAHIPGGEAVFFRSLLAIPVIVVWLMLRHELAAGFRTDDPFGHFWRGLMGTMAMGLGFAGLGYLPLPEVTAISYAAPLLTVILAAMFLGEQVRAFRITAVALGLVGVLIVLSPRISTVSGGGASYREAFGASLVLGSALFSALAQVFVRKLVLRENTATIVFWFSVTATVLSLATIPFGWVWPTPTEWVLLISAGLLGGVGQIFLTASYRHADASVIAPFEYASMIFSLAIGWFVFSEVPTWTMLGGAVLVVAAGILIIWREHKLGLERNKQRKSMTPNG
jgi:drug/metabolite transporter (DMT)-like permease